MKILLISFIFMISACVSRIDNRGFEDNQNNLVKIKKNISYKQDVLQLLGSPSAISNLGNEVWYYMNFKKETVAFLRPKIKQQKITAINFNKSGMVKSIKKYNKAGRDIKLSKRITPTEGKKLGIWEQLIGNIGKFNKQGEK